EVVEDLSIRMIRVVSLRASDVEVQLLRSRIHGAGLPRGRLEHDLERLPITHALRDHEVDLVVLIERRAIQRRMSVTPACDEEHAFWPVHVAAARVAMLEQPRRDTSVLAWRKLVKPIELDDVSSLR